MTEIPETEDFIKGVVREADYQRELWGTAHDEGKTVWDWFWLIGYLAQKAATAFIAGDRPKAQHHCISTAATLYNWHRTISGTDTAMQPGITECPSSPTGRHIVDTSMESGPNNCFHCDEKMP